MSSLVHSEDITAPDVIRDPYGYFGKLRDEDPVHWNPLMDLWIVTSHAEALWLARNHELFSSQSPWPDDPSQLYPPIDEADWGLARDYIATYRPFIFHDNPEHIYMRQAIYRWFTPKAVERWRAELRAMVHGLIESRLAEGGMEVKAHLALPLPLTTISWMLGVPLEDAPMLSDLVATFMDESASPHRFRAAAGAWSELRAYFTPLVEARAQEPTEDLISMLAAAEQQGVYDRDSCLASITNLMHAGHETTLSLITSGLLCFLRNPDQWELLCSDPVGLCASATEECLRYEPPLKLLVRRATQDVELGGKQIRAGQRVTWSPPAANRDPRVFTDPGRFDITRSPNPHIAFGYGIHRCIGAALARVEAQETFRALAETFPRISLIGDIEWTSSAGIRLVESLPIAWDVK